MTVRKASASLYRSLPERPGVYLMRDARGKLLYVGKAANLRRRVSSYFLRPHDARIERMVAAIRSIDHEETGTAIEALIREAELIKKLQPPWNIREKDDTSFLYAEITREEWPRVLLVRGKDPVRGRRFGPFPSSSSAREALRIIRRIFPFNTHDRADMAHFHRDGKECFDRGIGLCPGTCSGAVTKAEYRRTVRHITLFFTGKKERIISALEREMTASAKRLDFERAARVRKQLFALKHIQDVALIGEEKPLSPVAVPLSHRIEGYDISNISGASAVGSMVVFAGGRPAKSEYRKFAIRTVKGSNDVAMMREVLLRRFGNDWPRPDLILMDGGEPQVHAAEDVLRRLNIGIPVVGLAKGPERKRNDVHGEIPSWTDLATLVRVRDEAHRFAVTYHKALRARAFIPR